MIKQGGGCACTCDECAFYAMCDRIKEMEVEHKRLNLLLREADMTILRAFRQLRITAPQEITKPLYEFIKPRLSALRGKE